MSHPIQAVIAFVMTGTGSVYPIDQTDWYPFVKSRTSIEFEQCKDRNVDIRTPAQHIQNVRNILTIPISDLAALLEVSRQAIYKWLAQDSYPETDKLSRITELSKIADLFKKSDVNKAGMLLNMKIFEGRSLLDLFKDRKPYENEVKELIVEAQAMKQAYEKSGLAQLKAQQTNDWLSSISIPSYDEKHQVDIK